jgi:hypothetical protein
MLAGRIEARGRSDPTARRNVLHLRAGDPHPALRHRHPTVSEQHPAARWRAVRWRDVHNGPPCSGHLGIEGGIQANGGEQSDGITGCRANLARWGLELFVTLAVLPGQCVRRQPMPAIRFLTRSGFQRPLRPRASRRAITIRSRRRMARSVRRAVMVPSSACHRTRPRLSSAAVAAKSSR